MSPSIAVAVLFVAVVASVALGVALAAIWNVRRVRAQLREYGESLDSVVITGMRRDHFNLAHNVTQLGAQMRDHGQALQDVRAELFNRKDTRASPASECTCNRPE